MNFLSSLNHSNITQGLQRCLNSSDSPSSFSPTVVVGLALGVLSVGALWRCSRKQSKVIALKKTPNIDVPILEEPKTPNIDVPLLKEQKISKIESPITKEYREARKILRAPRKIESRHMVQNKDGSDTSVVNEYNYMTCSPKQSRKLHKMATVVFSKEQMEASETEIRKLAEKAIKAFVKRPYMIVDTSQSYAFNVFSKIFCGSKFRLSSFKAGFPIFHHCVDIVQQYEESPAKMTFIRYMKEHLKFNEIEITNIISSLIEGLTSEIGRAIVNVFSRWALNPEEFRKLRHSQHDREEFLRLLDRHLLECLRVNGVTDTGEKGVSLAKFRMSTEIIGADPLRFNPDRYEHPPFRPSHQTNWKTTPGMLFGYGSNPCPAPGFVRNILKIFFEMLLDQYEFRIGGDASKMLYGGLFSRDTRIEFRPRIADRNEEGAETHRDDWL